jgi:hypothetical protein
MSRRMTTYRSSRCGLAVGLLQFLTSLERMSRPTVIALRGHGIIEELG